MRILILIYELPPVGGGGGRAALDICRELVKRGHQVSILTSHYKDLPRQEFLDGINILRIPALRRESYRAPFSTMLAYVLSGFWAGLRFIRIFKPDVIHAHFAVPSGALAFALSIITSTPYILTAHLGDVPSGVPEKTDKWFRWVKPFTKPIWNHAKTIIAVSEHTRSLALKHYPVKIQVIPNGVDVEELAPTEIKLNSPIQIVFAGRFMPQKNPVAIPQTMAMIKDLDWRCAMLGDGPLFEEVKREIEKHSLQSRFTLPGWVTPEETLMTFSKSDILFMPSLSEGLPVVGVQALAKGLAFVVSDIGGFADLVNNDVNGSKIQPQDLAGFGSALRKLITDPQLLNKYRNSSLNKSHEFDIKLIAEKYQMILETIVYGK